MVELRVGTHSQVTEVAQHLLYLLVVKHKVMLFHGACYDGSQQQGAILQLRIRKILNLCLG